MALRSLLVLVAFACGEASRPDLRGLLRAPQPLRPRMLAAEAPDVGNLLRARAQRLSSYMTAERVVFTDCDGTLLQPDHTISPAAERMLERLDEAGVRVVPATGRARAGAWTEAVLNRQPALRRGAPGVFLNGCAAFNEEGQLVTETVLPETVAEGVLEWAAGLAERGMGLVAYVGGEALHTGLPAPLEKHFRALGDSPPRLVEEVPTQRCYKMILICGDDAAVQGFRPELEALYPPGAAELTQAVPGYLEIVPAGVSKAAAAKKLLDRWGLDWSDAVAIGDGENDVPLLRAAGTSIAMGNAKDSVQAAAQHVVASNAEDGWVDAMERFVLSKL